MTCAECNDTGTRLDDAYFCSCVAGQRAWDDHVFLSSNVGQGCICECLNFLPHQCHECHDQGVVTIQDYVCPIDIPCTCPAGESLSAEYRQMLEDDNHAAIMRAIL